MITHSHPSMVREDGSVEALTAEQLLDLPFWSPDLRLLDQTFEPALLDHPSFGSLQSLCLLSTGLTDELMEAILQANRQLEWLSLEYNEELTKDTMQALYRYPTLKWVDTRETGYSCSPYLDSNWGDPLEIRLDMRAYELLRENEGQPIPQWLDITPGLAGHGIARMPYADFYALASWDGKYEYWGD